MTLIFQDNPPAVDPPQTHALVIGIGRYSHLANVPHLGLGQLTSPVASARAFADWLITTPLNNPQAPLGTIEMLLSAPTAGNNLYTLPDGRLEQVEAATYDHIYQSFDTWFRRCNNNPNNVAVLYYCGHGLEKEHLALLPEDFGRYQGNPWATAINFHRTLSGMKTTCKAATQCYFIDTCRQVDNQTLETSDFGGSSLRQNDLTGLHNSPTSLVLFATQVGRSAYGNRNEVSRFTTTLIKALSGGGASRKGRNWVINLSNLASGVNDLMKLGNERELVANQMTNPLVEGPNYHSVIHHLAEKPSVTAKISCNPTEATARARLQLLSRSQSYDREPAADPWQIEVEAGTYDLKAEFDGGEFRPIEHFEEWVMPPYFERELEVD